MMNRDLAQSDALNFEERHWRRLGARVMDDFRVAAVVAKAAELLGPSPGRVLDLGCGIGPFTIYAAKKGIDVLGVDTSPHQIEEAQRIFAGIETAAGRLRCCDLADLAKTGEKFHSVVLLDVLEHVKDRASFLNLVREILDPDGRMVVCVPAIPNFFDDRDREFGHYLRYDRETLVAEAAIGGFAIDRIHYWNFLGWLHRRITGTNSAGGEFQAYDFRYDGGQLARGLNALLRHYFFLVENHVPLPVGLSLFAVFVPAVSPGLLSRPRYRQVT